MIRIHEIVFALEDCRIAAMIDGDTKTLAALISPQCLYVHASGESDTGRAYLEKVKSGAFGYEAADIDERCVVASATNLATIAFRLRATVLVGTVRLQTLNRCTAVWALQNTTFRLVAFQATPLAPSQPLAGAPSRQRCRHPASWGRR